jgi:hypothetical protein
MNIMYVGGLGDEILFDFNIMVMYYVVVLFCAISE